MGRRTFFTNNEFSIDKLFKWNLERDNENATIKLMPNIKELLLNKTTPEEEARFICKFSTESYKEIEIIKELKDKTDVSFIIPIVILALEQLRISTTPFPKEFFNKTKNK